MKESFLIYKSLYEPLKSLSFEEKGMLFDAIFKYQIEGIVPELPPLPNMAFQFVKGQFDRDIIKYENVVERNKNNGAKGGRPKTQKNPLGLLKTQKNPKKPKKADTGTDTDTDTDIISVSFETFRKSFPGTKRGLKTELENFLKKNNSESIKLLLPALEKEIQYRLKLVEQNEFIPSWKNLSTWINQKCWEQEFREINTIKQVNGKIAASQTVTVPLIDPEIIRRSNEENLKTIKQHELQN